MRYSVLQGVETTISFYVCSQCGYVRMLSVCVCLLLCVLRGYGLGDILVVGVCIRVSASVCVCVSEREIVHCERERERDQVHCVWVQVRYVVCAQQVHCPCARE